ncbi:putative TFIIIC transcription initiation factor complex subunits Tfc3 [Penicillium brasilianum]|uniref:Putative TFIIIC transcription initiation factor complex subunits Tfc3 n=1 Tax=Penicillium brasilianum TaxID=104259 RepID=A0A1S9RHQ9_PENBI|nr:putative TFIIIC transcription initiation factor complex subunits Tfc3 [Penicillium brasilianum]
MAPGLQELIDFLLNEVALCGSQGMTLPEILKTIHDFYKNASQDPSQRSQSVDRRFEAKVWSWLIRHPEVSVTPCGEWQHLSLEDAEQKNRELEESANHHAPEADGDEAEAEALPVSSSIRVFVSKERMWYALTGHEPDDTKVPASEFLLLSIIASRKSDGIAQTDLVRLSGQDKRSVPKRTDALAQKGYVEKRPIQIKSARTSLVTFRRFVKPATVESMVEGTSEGVPERPIINFDAFNAKLFEILREFGIISRNDLKRRLEFGDRWRWRVLSRALRKFERIGVLKRVRAKSQYNKIHPCVMLIREPTETDIAKFNAVSGDLNRTADDQADADDDIDDAAENDPTGADEGAIEMEKDKPVIEAGRLVPSWTPDRPVGNQIFDVVNNSGTEGITNHDINRFCFGSIYRRPSESALHRLTDCWQLSQPPHLRHLAIVRDTAIQRTTFFYVHYSASNFAKLVESGEASWEAVEFPAGKAKAAKCVIPAVDATAQRDKYGFHESSATKLLVKNGNASLFEALAVCKPPTYLLSSSDPMPVRLPDGHFTVDMGRLAVTGTIIPSPISARRHGGRPRGPRYKAARKQSNLSKMERSSPGIPDPNDPEEMELDHVPLQMPDHLTWEQPSRQTPRVGNKRDKLEGLSEKERFEALGMDETWTEYNVLVNECPNPGVYVTPQGKRRPAGRKQGRPARSRIAVFRSAKLASFSWFQQESRERDHMVVEKQEAPAKAGARQNGVSIAVSPGPSEEFAALQSATNVQSTPRASSRRKRAQDDLDYTDSPTPAPSAKEGPQHDTRRPQKQPRLMEPEDEANGALATVSESAAPEATTRMSAEVESAPAITRDKSPTVHALSDVEAGTAAPKRQRIGSPDQTAASEVTQTARTEALKSPAQRGLGRTRRTPQPFSRNWLSKAISPSTTTQPGQKPKLSHGLADRGGSISILRRKIIMEIVEKAGGAYPSVPEIWFPFATMWLKRKQKERPDNRTVKTAIRNLVEAGKLRQLTFCGKGPKGAMVTKTILAKPEMSPDDPLIKEMQRKLLSTNDQRLSYSPNIELDPELVRPNGHTGIPKLALPMVSDATVQLQQKPATVLAEEQRTERRVQKELLKKLEDQLGIGNDSSATGTKRLMKIGRRQPRQLGEDSMTGQTWIARPGLGRRIKGDAHRLVRTMSAIGPHGMLMHPKQDFHTSSGTFGTFGAAIRPYRQPMSGDVASSVRELAELASAPNVTQTGRVKTFHSKTERILRWELEHEEIFDESHDGNGTYIDQTVSDEFEQVPIEGEIRFDFDQPVAQALQPRNLMTTRSAKQYRQIRPRPTASSSYSVMPPGYQPFHKIGAPARRRIDGVDTSLPGRHGVQPDDVRLQRSRRRATLPPLDQTLYRKIMVAIVAVRVLAGGAEARSVDWDLVSAAFPKHDPNFILEHARSILNKSRLQIAGMQRPFQEQYLEAYAKQKVPVIDYNHLDKYNWPAVVEWANIELEFSTSEKAPLLPATREEFDSIFELRPEAVPTADELYTATSGITVSFKRGLMTHVPFAVQAGVGKDRAAQGPRKNELARLDVVKTWVRANVAASEATYNPPRAEEALKPFGTQLINSAVQSLLTDRVISMSNRGRIIPGRNYDLTDHLLSSLSRKRLIDCPILKRAAYFKTTILDPQLQSRGSFDVHYHAEDGDILALINLFSYGQVTLHPRGQPRSRFGLTEGGYLTRQMDKDLLRFDVEVRPTASYTHGNPIQARANTVPAPLPPPSNDPNLPPKLPLWFDIHGFLIPQLWEMSIASVLGCVCMRQGLSPERISGMIKPAMGAWEIELLLNWLKEIGIVDRQSCGEKNGWMVRDWWWMVLTEKDSDAAMPVTEAAAELLAEPAAEAVAEPVPEPIAEPVSHAEESMAS